MRSLNFLAIPFLCSCWNGITAVDQLGPGTAGRRTCTHWALDELMPRPSGSLTSKAWISWALDHRRLDTLGLGLARSWTRLNLNTGQPAGPPLGPGPTEPWASWTLEQLSPGPSGVWIRGTLDQPGVRIHWKQEQQQRREIIVTGQSYFSRLWPPIPLSARRVCTPRLCCRGRTDSPGGEGDGGSIFWKTREIGLPSYNDLSTNSNLYSLGPGSWTRWTGKAGTWTHWALDQLSQGPAVTWTRWTLEQPHGYWTMQPGPLPEKA